MEFEDMKRIWDTQNNEPIYGINEEALHKSILSKLTKGNKLTQISELACIIVYAFSGCFILAVNAINRSHSIFIYVLASWMLISSLYCLVSRIRRARGKQQFDRSMHGDLAYALSVAIYQVNFSKLMRWNTLPIGLITVVGVWGSGKSLWLALGVMVFFILAGYVSGWEHDIYVSRKKELEGLKKMLES